LERNAQGGAEAKPHVQSPHNEASAYTAERLAEAFKVGRATIERDGQVVNGLEPWEWVRLRFQALKREMGHVRLAGGRAV